MNYGKYNLAHADYRRALTLDSTNEEALKGLFKSSFHKLIVNDKNHSTSTREMEIRLQRNRDDPHSYLLLGDLAQRSKKYDSALSYYRTAVEMNPNYAHGWFKLGKQNQRKGLLNSSISMYRNASSLVPTQHCYLLALASAYEEKGLFQETIETRKTLVKLHRYLLPNLLKLASAFRSSGDLKRALHYYTLLMSYLKVEDIFSIRENRPPWTFELAEQHLLFRDIESISSYINSSYLLTKFLVYWPHSQSVLPTILDSKVQLLLSNDIAHLTQARPEFSERITLLLEKSDFPYLDVSPSVEVSASRKLTFNPVKIPECQ
jgi:tetratricopeptide (TPR) repeat protein